MKKKMPVRIPDAILGKDETVPSDFAPSLLDMTITLKTPGQTQKRIGPSTKALAEKEAFNRLLADRIKERGLKLEWGGPKPKAPKKPKKR